MEVLFFYLKVNDKIGISDSLYSQWYFIIIELIPTLCSMGLSERQSILKVAAGSKFREEIAQFIKPWEFPSHYNEI